MPTAEPTSGYTLHVNGCDYPLTYTEEAHANRLRDQLARAMQEANPRPQTVHLAGGVELRLDMRKVYAVAISPAPNRSGKIW